MTPAGRRRLAVAAASATLVAVTPARALAHGIGGRADLPVPIGFFVVGAGLAIVASFIALAVLWPEPRLQGTGPDRAVTASWLPGLRTALGVAGLAALILVVLSGILYQEEGQTVAPSLVWVYFWLVVPFLAVLVGNWWRGLSPWRFLASRFNAGVPEREDAGARLGVWPAAIAFVGFTWLELVSNTSATPRTLATAALIYTAYVLAATRYLGVHTGLRAGEAFETYVGVLGSISPYAWSEDPDDGSPMLTRRGWLRGLTALRAVPGTTFFVIAMIGTVTYDGMSSSDWWSGLAGTLQNDTWFETVALLGMVAVIGAAYGLASWVAARLANYPGGAAAVARSFAHTLVPIAFAYAFAHYFTLVLVEGQTLLFAASDPFGIGWNLFGTASWRISWVPAPEVVWYIQVAAIVAGHITGVALAHDRALAEFGGRVAVRTQYAMLALMVALTTLGLLILSG